MMCNGPDTVHVLRWGLVWQVNSRGVKDSKPRSGGDYCAPMLEPIKADLRRGSGLAFVLNQKDQVVM